MLRARLFQRLLSETVLQLIFKVRVVGDNLFLGYGKHLYPQEVIGYLIKLHPPLTIERVYRTCFFCELTP